MNLTPSSPFSFHRAPRALRVLVPVAVAAAVLVTFEPCLEAQFVNWDDNYVIVGNAAFRGFSADHLRWMFTSTAFGHYQPLTWLSYAVDDYLWRSDFWSLETFAFHLTNVLLHMVSTVLLYFVARALIGCATVGSAAPVSRSAVLGAGLAALVFALHPLRVESVAWVTERRDVLSMAFYLTCVAAYLRYATRGGARWYVAALCALVLSLLSKASAVTLPVVLLVLDVYPLRRLAVRRDTSDTASDESLGDDDAPVAGRTIGALIVEKVPFMLVCGAAALMALIAQHATGAAYTLAEYDVTARLAQAVIGLAFYPYKTLVPLDLGPLYEMPPRVALFGPMLWASAAFVAFATLLAIRWRRRIPWWPVSWCVYVVTVAPVLGLFQSGPQLVADRYSYFSCLPWAVLFGGAMTRVFHRAGRSARWRTGARACGAGGVVLGAWMSVATTRQCDVWQWSLSLWHQALVACPESPIAHVNYADALANIADRLGDVDALREAVSHYQRGLALDPTDAIAWAHLARVSALIREDRIAIGAYRRAIALDPDRPGLFLEYARLLLRRGEPARAVGVLMEDVRRHPDHLDSTILLASLWSTHPDADVRDGAAALRLIERVNRSGNGATPAILEALGTALAEVGRFEDAADAARRALDALPTHGDSSRRARLEQQLALYQRGEPARSDPR